MTIAFVTGGARGIGRAAAGALAARGARVAIADLDAAAARAAAQELGEGHVGLGVDVTSAASAAGALDAAEQALGPVDVFINNAGVMAVGPFLEEADAATELMLGVNVLGVVHGTREAGRRMAARGRGQIINVASAASWFAPPGEATYAATKHAVRGLSRAVREELAPHGIRVAVVMPGVVATELAAGTSPGRGRLLAPEEVGEAIAALTDRHRDEVFVPREIGVAGRLWAVLPTGAARRLGRALGLDAIATHPDHAARAAYERRVLAAHHRDAA